MPKYHRKTRRPYRVLVKHALQSYNNFGWGDLGFL